MKYDKERQTEGYKIEDDPKTYGITKGAAKPQTNPQTQSQDAEESSYRNEGIIQKYFYDDKENTIAVEQHKTDERGLEKKFSDSVGENSKWQAWVAYAKMVKNTKKK